CASGSLMVISIRLEYTRYAHWGGRSGYNQFVRHLDPQRFETYVHAASHGDADLAWLRPMWRIIKALLRRGRMPWYGLSDLNAELFRSPRVLRAGLISSTFSMAN